MRKLLALLCLLFGSYVSFSQTAGSSPCSAIQLYPYTSCGNSSGAQYAGYYQSENAAGNNVTMSGSTTLNPTCTPDNETTQPVEWLAVTATTTSFTITNQTDYAGPGAATAETRDYVIYSGSCGSLTQISCNANIALNGTVNVTGLTVGQTYYIMVSQSDAAFTGYPTANATSTCITSTVPYVSSNNACNTPFNLVTNVIYTSTNSNASADGPSVCQNPASGSVENNVWYQWCAPSNWTPGQTAFLNVNNQVCNSTQGLQLSIYDGVTDCADVNGGTATSLVCQNPGSVTNYSYTFTANPNQCYLITLDGFAGTACTYNIQVSATSNTCTNPPILSASATTPNICSGGSTPLSVTCSGGGCAGITYTWSPSAGLSATTGSSVTANPTTTTTYTVTGTTATCTAVATVTVNVSTVPTRPTVNTTAASCSAVGTATISNYVGTQTYTFTPTGPTVGAGGVISGMTAGTSYTVITSNGTCNSLASLAFSIAAQLTVPATPTITIVPPTCSAVGTATISNYVGTQTYTFTPSGPTAGAGGVISGMTAGTSYTVTTSNGTCTSLASLAFSIAAQLTVPATPTITVVPPTCSAAGTATISNYVGTQTYTFTPAGPTAGAGGAISGMVVGTSYTIITSNASCPSLASASFSIAAQLPLPATPTASVTVQPTCVSLGTIVVTNPTGANIQYSIGGSYQASGTFNGLTAGTYSVTAQNTTTGCISNAVSLVVNTPPGAPAAPTASVTVQPTCIVTTGTIVVTAPTGASIQYSIDGTNYQSSGTFANLNPGTYNVTAQDMSSSCVSAFTSLTINPANPPAAPTASVTLQPTCTSPTGTIVVTAPTGSTIEYSIDGTSYQANGTFTNLNPGTYNVTAQDMSTGCISAFTAITINPIPNPPTAPTASVTVQPTCTTPTGTIVVSAPTGATIEYSIDGSTYQANGTFTNLNPGTYNITAQDMSTGCISAFTAVTVNPIPNPPAAPTASVTVQPTCIVSTGIIVVTAPTGANIEYSIDGTTYQANGTFVNLNPGTYNVTAQDMSTGCISTVTAVTVDPVPNPPAAPTASVTVQPTCTTPTGTIVVTAPTGSDLQYSIGGAYQASGTFNGLTAGTYTITVQNTTTGCISLVTAVTIDPLPLPPAAPTASVTIQPTCLVTTGTIVVTAPTGATIEYSIDGTSYQANGTFTNLNPGTYNVTAQDMSTGCISAFTAVTVNPIPNPPAAPTASVTVQPTCTTPTGTIVVTAPTGATIEYSIDGTTYQANGTFVNLNPGTYNITAQDMSTGCISSVTAVTVDPVPNPPAAPTASVTVQPTCVTLGTIVVTDPTGSDLQYSIGGAYQASGTFNGLTAGTYTITVQNTTTGCISNATAVVVNTPPGAPAAPTASVTVQPTCTTPTGTIVITAPTGATIEYSIDGTSYQANGTFTNLNPGTYNVTAQDMSTGCISAFTAVTVNPIPNPPAAPTASVTVQPTCTTPTGTIVVTAPTGATIEYSIDGTTYQANGTFANLNPGTYNVTAQDMSTGCISSPSPLTINTVPGAPAAPTASVTVQPTCTTPTGTIVVTAPTGASIEYSIDGTSYQANGTFANLNPGTYNITAQDMSTGCISSPSIVTINPVPGAPAAPTASVTQPTCTTPTGTIVVTAPTGASIEYSIDGTSYQANTSFAGLTPGTTYNVIAQDMSTGCISAFTAININAIPNPPAAPTASVTVQPTCPAPTGTIVVTAPTGATIEYSIDGSTYQASGTFANLNPGTYNITAQDMSTGCISSVSSLIINTVPGAPVAPTASATVQPICSAPTGSIVVTAPAGASIQYSIDGASYQTSGTFSNLNPGTYNVTAQDVNTGCVSPITAVTVNALPAAPTVNAGPSVSLPCGTSTTLNGTTNAINPVYTWSGPGIVSGGNTASVLINSGGTYTLNVQDLTTGCSNSSTVVVIGNSVTAGFTPNITSGIVPLTVSFANTSTNAATYSWNFGDGNTSTISDPSNTFTTGGTYTVVLIVTSGNCKDSAKAIIEVIGQSVLEVPNVFTPNGDGKNDEFKLIHSNLSEFKAMIFDRWGLKVIEFDNPNIQWDGKNGGGVSLPDATYYYLIEAKGKDNKEYKLNGYITVIR